MPLFVFEVIDGSETPDPIEITLRHERDARLQAIRFAGELMTCEGEALLARGDLQVDVRNAADRLLFSLTCRIAQAEARSVGKLPECASVAPGPLERRPH